MKSSLRALYCLGPTLKDVAGFGFSIMKVSYSMAVEIFLRRYPLFSMAVRAVVHPSFGASIGLHQRAGISSGATAIALRLASARASVAVGVRRVLRASGRGALGGA
jgi:hypothetical protein